MLLVIAFLCFAALFAAWILSPTTPPAPSSAPVRMTTPSMPDARHLPV